MSERDYAIAEALFLSIGEGAIVTDEVGRISRVNDVALSILGYQADELLGRWYPETVVAINEDGTVIPNIERPITEAFITGKPVFRKVLYRTKSSKTVPVALTVSPVILDGQPVGAIEVFRNIQEEVELSNAKDEFISVASHQLRTPATVVKHYLGLLLEGYLGELSAKQQHAASTANDYNDTQLETINNILRVAQADANKIRPTPQPTDVSLLAAEAISAVQDSYRMQKLGIKFRNEATFTTVNIDPLHLRMVIENLLDNARKYSRENSKEVIVAIGDSAEHVCIDIIDDGIGIHPEDLPKLFQKFSRIPSKLSDVNGTGLGLYWARKLVELYEGKISVQSEFDKGTTITIKLPKSGA